MASSLSRFFRISGGPTTAARDESGSRWDGRGLSTAFQAWAQSGVQHMPTPLPEVTLGAWETIRLRYVTFHTGGLWTVGRRTHAAAAAPFVAYSSALEGRGAIGLPSLAAVASLLSNRQHDDPARIQGILGGAPWRSVPAAYITLLQHASESGRICDASGTPYPALSALEAHLCLSALPPEAEEQVMHLLGAGGLVLRAEWLPYGV